MDPSEINRAGHREPTAWTFAGLLIEAGVLKACSLCGEPAVSWAESERTQRRVFFCDRDQLVSPTPTLSLGQARAVRTLAALAGGAP